MKNEGITILQIVITVVIMMIIASVAIFYGQNVTKEANLSSIYNEVKEIKSAVKEIYIMGQAKVTDENINLYGEIDIPRIEKNDYSGELKGAESGDYYYLDFISSKKLKDVLDFDQSPKHDYILDWQNLNIYLVGGVEVPSADSITGNSLIYDANEIVKYYDNIFVK